MICAISRLVYDFFHDNKLVPVNLSVFILLSPTYHPANTTQFDVLLCTNQSVSVFVVVLQNMEMEQEVFAPTSRVNRRNGLLTATGLIQTLRISVGFYE